MTHIMNIQNQLNVDRPMPNRSGSDRFNIRFAFRQDIHNIGEKVRTIKTLNFNFNLERIALRRILRHFDLTTGFNA